jgi:hypothetical protein
LTGNSNANKVVAFTASLSLDISPVIVNQVIKFDRVLTNIGSAYNSHDGVFRAPVSGAYEFAVTVMAPPDHAVHVDIIKDGGEVLCYAYGAPSDHDSGTCVVMVQLIEGNDVWVRHDMMPTSANEAIYHSYSSFSGHLIQADWSNLRELEDDWILLKCVNVCYI